MHSEGQSVVLSGIPQPASGGDNATGAGREGMLPVEQPDRSFDDRARVFRLLSCVRETTQIRCSFTVTNESSTDATLYLNNSDDPTLAIPEISELTDRSGRNFAATSCEIEGQESVYSRDINSGPTCVRRGITPGTTVKGMVGFQGVDPTVKTIAILSIAYETYDGAGGVAFFKNVPVKS
jgi:hypothetical protein